jgi:hypothetical protein
VTIVTKKQKVDPKRDVRRARLEAEGRGTNTTERRKAVQAVYKSEELVG